MLLRPTHPVWRWQDAALSINIGDLFRLILGMAWWHWHDDDRYTSLGSWGNTLQPIPAHHQRSHLALTPSNGTDSSRMLSSVLSGRCVPPRRVWNASCQFSKNEPSHWGLPAVPNIEPSHGAEPCRRNEFSAPRGQVRMVGQIARNPWVSQHKLHN